MLLYRAGALPFHNPDSLSGVANVTDDPSNPNSNATFFEPRPHGDTTYYVIVVSHGEVEFKVRLRDVVFQLSNDVTHKAVRLHICQKK